MANVYPKVHEILKFPAHEDVILEDPLSLTGTLSSMKNLDDAFTIRDQFINDKATKDEPEKLNVESKVVSMVIVPIYQASSSVPPLSTSLRDLPHKIDETVRETVKEVVQVALQASLRDRFINPPEADMKEMLHQQMFETGSYKSLPKHVALYEALEASMERAQRDEFLAKKDNHVSDASGSKQPPALQSSTLKTTDTRDTPSSSSKQQSGPHSKQPVEDIPMPDIANISNSEDTGFAHLPKIKPRPEWLKPIPEEDRPESLEPNWSVPPNNFHEPENNWANALAKSYKDPVENKLLRKTGDMGS
ncbi:hypothetical protein Tco_1197784 [Tanacetum coccineum]